ncbi:hypothetical protein LJC55_02365 [Eubacteriales bacterium OttesenSCG-928-N14]|nr:hypothetical protein [Eubacteriales bacterium OttesenSCG-928-N14]
MDMEQHPSSFIEVTGIVQELRPAYKPDGSVMEGRGFIAIEDENGQPVMLDTNAHTLFLGNGKLQVGAQVVAYVRANRPMILIYPPQHRPSVVVVGDLDENLKVEYFNRKYISADNALKLNLPEGFLAQHVDGRQVDASEIFSRYLAVLYGPSTRSIPAQTTPSKVYVLDIK